MAHWGVEWSATDTSTNPIAAADVNGDGKDDFIGQALVPLSDISLDGTPMGFDLTLQLHTKQQPTGGATRASVAVELTFNPLS